MNKKQLQQLSAVSVADAAKFFPGVVVKDYGGIGGLKTISVRSLGANHTGLMYDGLVMGDAQAGQQDLGRISSDNLESVALYSSMPADIFLPARAFASSSILLVQPASVQNLGESKLTATIRGGSFGLINPSVLWEQRLSQKSGLVVNGEYQYSKGNYPFIDYETGNSKKYRNNADVHTAKAEAGYGYRFNDSSELRLRGYFFQSDRGLPGAVVLFNDFSAQRLSNRHAFLQGSWMKHFNQKTRFQLAGKFTSDYKYYLDPVYPSITGKLENIFKQKEYYVTAATAYQLFKKLSVAYAADFFRNELSRTDNFALSFANPVRNSFLQSATVRYKGSRLEAQAQLLHSMVREKVEAGNPAKPINIVKPAIGISYKLLNYFPLFIRASFKSVFRNPSFDDLYYTNIGNTNLRPEYSDQYNVGFTGIVAANKLWKQLFITVDGYYNNISDRILATPRQNLFQWSMRNIGKTIARGCDVSLNADMNKIGHWQWQIFLNYSYQQAVDRSNKQSPLYNAPLPYTPRHSGAVRLAASYRQWSVAYNALLSGYRYRLGEPIADNIVKEWATQDLLLAFEPKRKQRNKIRFTLELNNIFNNQYEVIRYYPMPRFNFRTGLRIMFS